MEVYDIDDENKAKNNPLKTKQISPRGFFDHVEQYSTENRPPQRAFTTEQRHRNHKYAKGCDGIDIATGLANFAYGSPVETLSEQTLDLNNSFKQCYYLRIAVTDKPGVLSEVSSILRDHGLSIASMIQNEQSNDGSVFLVLTTHKCAKKDIESAAIQISNFEYVLGAPILIPIYDSGSFG